MKLDTACHWVKLVNSGSSVPACAARDLPALREPGDALIPAPRVLPLATAFADPFDDAFGDVFEDAFDDALDDAFAAPFDASFGSALDVSFDVF